MSIAENIFFYGARTDNPFSPAFPLNRSREKHGQIRNRRKRQVKTGIFPRKQRRFDENKKSMRNKPLKQYFLLQMSALPGSGVEKTLFRAYSIPGISGRNHGL